jgi:hypothetical protein
MKIQIILASLFLILTGAVVRAQVASGGAYTLNQAAIANGGGTTNDTTNNVYKVEGTGGQAAAGTNSTNSSYSLRSGFWSPAPLAPTAAQALISGRVVNAGGAGIRNVTVSLTGGTLITPRIARTNSFGYFSFEAVEVGQTYVVSVESRRYGFAENTRVFSLMEDLTNVVFQATWEN